MNDWHPEDIKAALRKKGLTLKEIAESEKVSPSYLTHVIYGVRSKRIQKILADLLEKDPESIWPSRYPKAKKAA